MERLTFWTKLTSLRGKSDKTNVIDSPQNLREN